MATQALGVSNRDVNVGRVFERAFTTIRHNPSVTLGLAFLFGAVPNLLVVCGFWSLGVSPAVTDRNGLPTSFFVATIGTIIATFVISALVQAMLTMAALAESEGRKAPLLDCLRAGLAVLLPLVVLAVLSSVAIFLGFMLLIFPGVMLYTAWAVASQVLVTERVGIFGALSRSKDLTRGARWKILGVGIVALIIVYIFSAIAGFLAAATIGVGALTVPEPLNPGYILFNLVIGAFSSLVMGMTSASLYVELRDWKDGPMGEKLEEVFA